MRTFAGAYSEHISPILLDGALGWNNNYDICVLVATCTDVELTNKDNYDTFVY